MSEKFVASNGIEVVVPNIDGGVRVGEPNDVMFELTRKGTDAMREFFLHERDTELGRWRCGSNPTIVGYPDGADAVLVASERTGASRTYTRNGTERPLSYLTVAADEYFTAMPEPKPWHDAKPGEVWVIDGEPAIALTDEGSVSFQFGDVAGDPSRVNVQHPDIKNARRIFPEVVSDDS